MTAGRRLPTAKDPSPVAARNEPLRVAGYGLRVQKPFLNPERGTSSYYCSLFTDDCLLLTAYCLLFTVLQLRVSFDLALQRADLFRSRVPHGHTQLLFEPRHAKENLLDRYIRPLEKWKSH